MLIHSALARDALTRAAAATSGSDTAPAGPSAYTLWQLFALMHAWLTRDTPSMADRKAAKAYQDTLQKVRVKGVCL